MVYTKEDGPHVIAEPMARRASRPVKAVYALATLSAKTERGGEIASASTGMVIDGHRIACVGDMVRYPDGTESKIVSGAGFAMAFNGQPIAVVGSATDNGDTIVSSLQNQSQIIEFADGTIPGLLQPSYVVPAKTSNQNGTA